MKRYNIISIAVLLGVFTACSDSKLDDWEPYFPTSSQQPSSSLSVDKTNISVGAASSKESIVITSTESWTATTSETWITLSVTSGSSTQTVTINFDENMTTTKRTGKVTITNASGKSVVVNITQDGKSLTIDSTAITFQPEGGSSVITITTNGSYTWNKNEIDSWLTISQDKEGLNITAAKNPNTQQRIDTLTIYMTGLTEGSVSHDVVITQFGTEYSFEVDKTAISTGSSKYSETISITTNDEWTASTSNSWISLSATSGTGDKAIDVTISDNTSTETRTGSITITGVHSDNTSTITVNQSGRYLTVEPSSVSFGTEGGSSIVTVDTDGSFSASTANNWITIKTNGNQVTITTTRNDGKTTRNGEVTIKLTDLTKGSLARTVTVSQAGTDYNFSVNKNTLTGTSASWSENIILTTNDSWTATSNSGWITLSKTSGTNNATIKVTISENTTTSQRTGTVTLKGTNSGSSLTVNVIQEGKYLTVAPTSLNFGADGGSSSVTVSTDGSFTTSKSDSWITVSTSGNSITITASKNSSSSSRSGSVTVSMTGLTSGSITRTITVSQAGSNYNFAVNKTSITATSSATSSTIVLTTNDSWTASSNSSWLTISSTSGTGNANLTIKLEENKTTNSRSGTIVIQGTNSGSSATISVTQDGKYLTVSPESLNFSSEGGTKAVTVSTDGTFTTSSDVNWITVSTSGNTITVKASANSSTSSRTGSVAVSLIGLSSGSLSKAIVVSQNGNGDVTFEDYGDLKPLD